jgi:uncharacterized protein (DUF1330 family)
MAKGYWIAHVDVHDPDQYKFYVEGAGPAFKEFDGKFLARGGAYETMDGDSLGARHVVIEFKDVETAKACFNSETYQKARAHRLPASTGRIVIVEGLD